MGRRTRPEPIDPATLPPPAVLARQIARGLRAAVREFEAVARSLEPGPPPDGARPGDQLALDLSPEGGAS